MRDAIWGDADERLELAGAFVTSFPLDEGAFHGSLERLLGHRDAMLLVAEGERAKWWAIFSPSFTTPSSPTEVPQKK